MKRPIPNRTIVAGKNSAGVTTREPSFAEARRLGLKEHTLEKKEFFKPIVKKQKKG